MEIQIKNTEFVLNKDYLENFRIKKITRLEKFAKNENSIFKLPLHC